MKPGERQSETDPSTSYFDPESSDMSEQYFSASLDAETNAPRFVLDDSGKDPDPRGKSASVSDGETSDASSEPAAGDTDTGPEVEADQGQVSPGDGRIDSSQDSEWRNLVSAKVNNYKSRRPRKDRYPSLNLPFDSGHSRPRSHAQQSSTPASFSQSIAAETAALQPVYREPDTPISLESTARILEFPRSAALTVSSDELAEPIIPKPRIVEAPELLPPPPAMGGILIEPVREPEPERRPGFDMPLQSASLRRRACAGAVDAIVVSIAIVAFGYVFFRLTNALLPWRTTAGVAAGLFALLWPAYQYAFLVYSETTPGLRLTKLEIQRFDGNRASRKVRRWRVLASILSAVSLGLGYAWCFLDEDRLSWHDRITKTHLARLQPRS